MCHVDYMVSFVTRCRTVCNKNDKILKSTLKLTSCFVFHNKNNKELGYTFDGLNFKLLTNAVYVHCFLKIKQHHILGLYFGIAVFIVITNYML